MPDISINEIHKIMPMLKIIETQYPIFLSQNLVLFNMQLIIKNIIEIVVQTPKSTLFSNPTIIIFIEPPIIQNQPIISKVFLNH